MGYDDMSATDRGVRFKKYHEADIVPCEVPPRARDLAGEIFERLTVVCYAGKQKDKLVWWCRCTCGEITRSFGTHLVGGFSTSCGCLRQRVVTKHGMARTNIYRLWQNIMTRCYKQGASAKYYKDRGIYVCKNWHDFNVFYEEFGKYRPSTDHTVDREDNSGPYSKSNCRWVLWNVQMNNKRNNIYLTVGGKTKTLAQWCGGSDSRMYQKAMRDMHLRGKTPAEALTNVLGEMTL